MTKIRHLEPILDWAAALWIASALVWALMPLGTGFGVVVQVACFVAGAVGGVVTLRLLSKLGEKPHCLPNFDPQPLEWTLPGGGVEIAGELLLTPDMKAAERKSVPAADQERLPSTVSSSSIELLLSDALGQPDPDSRVVQLFDPARMPTAGELKSRIDRHLGKNTYTRAEQQPDASDALYEALADLRRSLA
jgi:crotonobetainyl-CoA:carnitine CoA-transferase CaiB-like acyl-CoA transferase